MKLTKEHRNELKSMNDVVVIHKDGTVSFKDSFFYRFGKTPDNTAQKYLKKLAAAGYSATILEATENWAAWPTTSYMVARFQINGYTAPAPVDPAPAPLTVAQVLATVTSDADELTPQEIELSMSILTLLDGKDCEDRTDFRRRVRKVIEKYSLNYSIAEGCYQVQISDRSWMVIRYDGGTITANPMK